MAKKQEFCKECDYLGYRIKDNYPPCAVAIMCPSCAHVCSWCQGEGFIKKVNLIMPCECQKLTNKIALFNKTKTPSRFTTSLKTENFSKNFLKEPYKQAVEFVKNFHPLSKGLVFFGPVGCGKTTLVSAIIQKITLEKEYSCLFVEFSRLLEEIKNCYSNNNQAEMDLLDKICRHPLLVIDELGTIKDTEWELGIIDNLINRRYNAKQTTLFTTNFTLKKCQDKPTLRSRLSKKTYSRIQEMCEFITIKGIDLRAKDSETIHQNTPNTNNRSSSSAETTEMEV